MNVSFCIRVNNLVVSFIQTSAVCSGASLCSFLPQSSEERLQSNV
jgi:hypothetical protein